MCWIAFISVLKSGFCAPQVCSSCCEGNICNILVPKNESSAVFSSTSPLASAARRLRLEALSFVALTLLFLLTAWSGWEGSCSLTRHFSDDTTIWATMAPWNGKCLCLPVWQYLVLVIYLYKESVLTCCCSTMQCIIYSKFTFLLILTYLWISLLFCFYIINKKLAQNCFIVLHISKAEK